MSENSPRWKNPEDIMKMHKIKKRKQTAPKKETKDETKILFRERTTAHLNYKRKNPFSCQLVSSQRKRIRHETHALSPKKVLVEFNQNIFNILEHASEEKIFNKKVVVPQRGSHNETTGKFDVGSPNDENSLASTVETSLLKETLTHDAGSPDDTDSSVDTTSLVETDFQIQENASGREEFKSAMLQVLPVDWSLKVKARVTCASSLAWCTQFKAMDEAQSVMAHVCCTDLGSCEENKTAFLSYCHYWVHPNLPWLKAFPRIVSDVKISRSSPSLSTEVQQALQKDWLESFTSAFHLLRCEMCPYFYLCTHQFTVLFRAPHVHGRPVISALLSPTSRGFREALHNEGITYMMPNLDNCKQEAEAASDLTVDGEMKCTQDTPAQSTCYKPSECDALPDDDVDLMHTDEGASIWLESMGLDKKHFPSLDPNKVKLQREGFRQVDNRPESLVFVEGQHVQALFNFLLNCRTCIASSGPQTGIPPTILAPLAFRGATLKANVVKYSATKMLTTTGPKKEQHILEIAGPILPHHVLNLSSLLRRTQDKEVTLTFKTHDSSAALNINPNSSAMNGVNNSDNGGLHPDASSVLDSNMNKPANSRLQLDTSVTNLKNTALHPQTHSVLDSSMNKPANSQLQLDTNVTNLKNTALHPQTHSLLDSSAKNLENSGLHPDTHGLLAGSKCLEQMTAIKEATCSKLGFTYIV